MLYKPQPKVLAVTSDSHGDYDALEQVLLDNPNIDGLLFLGDGMREFEDLQNVHPELPMVGVPGNCDFWCRGPHTKMYQDKGLKLMLTHGHYYHVKTGLEYLLDAAKSSQVAAVLYGHTHREKIEQDSSGIWIINPGSLGFKKTYALMKISENSIQAEMRCL